MTCCPTLLSSSTSNYVVAPFGANTNIASGTGRVSYEVHNITTSPSLLSQVNRYIQQSTQHRFYGTWMLVAEWENVPQSGQSTSLVHGCIRSCISVVIILFLKQTNTFQGIVVTNGYQSFSVFIYRCGSLQWSGDAVIGFKVNSELLDIHALIGSNTSTIACQNLPGSVWSNVVYQLSKDSLLQLLYNYINYKHHLDLRELPFLPNDTNKILLPSNVEDSVSDSVPIPGGFPLGNSNQTTVYVRVCMHVYCMHVRIR